jgi:hypothetical protein
MAAGTAVIMTHSDHWKMVMTTALYTSHLLPVVKPNPFEYLPTKSTIPTLLFLVRKIEVNFFAPFRRVCAVLMDCLRHSQITVRCCQLLRNSEQFRFLTYLQNMLFLVRRLRTVQLRGKRAVRMC